MMAREKKAAFQQIYADHSRDLFAFLMRSLRNDSLARDLLQDTFLNFIRIYQEKDLPEINACRMYLFRTARNLMINRARSSQNRKEVALTEDAPSGSSPEEAYLDSTAMQLREEALQELLATLNERDSSILQMRYAHDMKLEEIASVMELSTSSVSRRLDKARTALIQILKKKEGK